MSVSQFDIRGLDSNLSDPLRDLESRVVGRFQEVEAWLRTQFVQTPPPFYYSVDLRSNGEKIVPVDTNLFPGGFNNLSASSYSLAIGTLRRKVGELCPGAKSILLVPERHTRNVHYLDNIAVLCYLLECAGIKVMVGLPGIKEPVRVQSGKGIEIEIHPTSREGGRLLIGDFVPCAVLFNNDLSSEDLEEFADLEIPVFPGVQAGWQTRRKSRHFHWYEQVAEAFAKAIGFDPWFIVPEFSLCDKVDIEQSKGLECLSVAIEEMLSSLREHYMRHGIGREPFVAVKSDAGTYGMGVTTIRNPDEIRSLNRKRRKELAVSKGGRPIRSMLIQEGIHTIDRVGEIVAEPVVYGLDDNVVGGFYRLNPRRSTDENLNSPGMEFRPLPFDAATRPPSPFGSDESQGLARLYVYGVVARLAALAAAHEERA